MIKIYFIGVMGLLFVAGCSLSPAAADSTPLAATPTLIVYQLPEATSTPQTNLLSTGRPTSLLAEIQAHTRLYHSVMLAEPGWVHLIIRPDGFDHLDITRTFAESYQEGWYRLDDNAEVITAVEKLVDEKGRDTQTFIFQRGEWREAASGDVVIRNLPGFFKQADTFVQQVARLLAQGEQLSSQTIYSNCWYIGEQYTVSDGDFRFEAVFDPAEGNLKALKTWQVTDSAVKLVSGIDVLKEEHLPAPPAEIAALLGEVPSP
jgi:hypothetical protein